MVPRCNSRRLGILVSLATATLIWLTPQMATASDEDFVGILAIAVEDDVASRLKLDAETKAKLQGLIDQRIDDAQSLVLNMRDLSADEQKKRMAEFAAESEAEGLKFLSEGQVKLLRQQQVARGGMLTLLQPEIAAQLGLSEDQKKEIATLMSRMKQDMTKGGEIQRQITRSKYERRLADVLSKAQLTGWEILAGIVDEAPAAVVADVGDDEPPGDAGEAGDSNATDEDSGKSPASSVADGKKGTGKLRFNFTQTPWEPVLKWFADEAGYSLQMDSPPLGTFNLVDESEYSPAEALDQINGLLLTRGYTLVRNRHMLILVNIEEDAIPSAIIETVTPEQLDERGKYEIVKCLFTLDKMTTDEAQSSVSPLVTGDGSMSVIPSSKQLLIQETGGNLRMIRAVIERSEAAAKENEEDIKITELQHVIVDDVMSIARSMLKIDDEDWSTSDGSLTIAASPLGTRVFYSGKPEMIKRFEAIIKSVDVDPKLDADSTAPSVLELKVYSHRADPESVLNVVQVMLAGIPDVRAASDPETGNLVVLARAPEHAQVQELLDKMQRDAVQFEVIELRKYDAQSMILMLNSFFGQTGEEGEEAKGPTITGDITSNTLIVRGTAAEIAQIQALVDKMDPPLGPDALADRERVRMIPLDGIDPLSVLEEVDLLWPNMRRENRIRVIAPALGKNGIGARRIMPPEDNRLPIDSLRDDSRNPLNPRELDTPKEDPEANSNEPAKLPGKSAARFRRRLPIQFVGFEESVDDDDSDDTGSSQGSEPGRAETQLTRKFKSKSGAEITVRVTESGIFIQSDDLDALDDYETLVRSVLNQRGTQPAPPTIVYLKYVKAVEAASLLNEVLGISGDGGGGGGGGLLGGLASNLIGGVGGDLLGGLLGGGDDAGGSSLETTGTVKITPEARLNALIVQANATDLALIEEILQEIDRSYAPQDPKEYGETHIIPIYYTTAEDIANVVKQAFPQQISSGASSSNNSQRQQQQAAQQFFQQMMGGRRGRGGSQQRTAEEQKMSIGVDARSNSLIVTGPEHLYMRVRDLVAQLDRRSIADNEGFSVVSLKGNVNPELLKNALSSILGENVETSSSSGASDGSSSQNSSSKSSSTPSRSPSAPSSQGNNQLEFLRNLQRMRDAARQGQGGGPGGGARPSIGGPPTRGPGGGGPGAGGRRGGR